jgi:alpha-beta hydrolase superfamily lysophospholipase
MLLPFTSEMCTRDSAYQQGMDSDKREIKVATPVLLSNILLAEARAGALSKKLSCPVLFQVPLDLDNFVDPEGTRNIFRALRIPDKKIIFYPLMLHSLSVDLGRKRCLNDILDWLNGR